MQSSQKDSKLMKNILNRMKS
jgi:hypothetical protein